MTLDDVYDVPGFLRRFYRYVGVIRSNGCREWTGPVVINGYGYICITENGKRPRNIHAHRASLLIEQGSLIDGSSACHKCNNRLCTLVSPEHVYEGTQATNVQDMLEAGRAKKALVRTYCSKGHEITAESSYFTPKGHFICRVCRRTNSVRHREHKAELQGVTDYGVHRKNEEGRIARKYPLGWDATIEAIVEKGKIHEPTTEEA